MNYGFTCDCPLCTAQKGIGQPPSLPRSPEENRRLEEDLCAYALSSARLATATPERLLGLPRNLYPCLNSSYLPDLSEKFSQASHEGKYEVALPAGRALLALYTVLYPDNYPQIGKLYPHI